jgi:transposase
MTIKNAGDKANLGTSASYKYYGLYREDPEHKIPKLGKDVRRGKGHLTYEKIEALINSIIHDKLTIDEAAKKAGMHKKTVMNYYTKYMTDPERKIPVRATIGSSVSKVYTQENVKKIIDYVENDKMTIRDAAKKLDMGESSAYIYYNKYKNDPEKKIPIPHQTINGNGKTLATHEQVKDLIRFIVDDEMSLKEAAAKVELPYSTANTYYTKYLRDPNHEIPVPGKPSFNLSRRCTSEEVKQLINYIVKDKMNASDAARKIGVAPDTARLYYQKYLNDPNRNIPVARKPVNPTKCCTSEQIERVIGHIVNDKMSIAKAALKVGIGRNTASMYYRRYKEEGEMPVPENRDQKVATPDQVTRFLGHVLDDKMTIIDAGRQAGLRRHMAYIFYKVYKEDPLKGLKFTTDEQVQQLVGYVNDDNMTVKAAAEKINMPYDTALRIYSECKDHPGERVLNKMDLYHQNLQTIAEFYKKRHNIKDEELQNSSIV